jgi:hypothetical protein
MIRGCRAVTCPSLPSSTHAERVWKGWRVSRAGVRALLLPIHDSAMEAPRYPPLMMFKILLLQQWHMLSDPAAEEAVRDRLSFRRFCVPPLEVETPDRASIWPFRQMIDKLGLSAVPLVEVNRQLDARGFVIKRGALVDTTIIAGAVRRPYEGSGVNPRDHEARLTRKRDKTYFGYKAQLAVDEESGLAAPGRDESRPMCTTPGVGAALTPSLQPTPSPSNSRPYAKLSDKSSLKNEKSISGCGREPGAMRG